MVESLSIRELGKFLKRVDIVRIGDIIGHYEDINNKNKNIVDGVKMFKKCKVELFVRPKEPKIHSFPIDESDIIIKLVRENIHFDYWFSNDHVYIRDNGEYRKEIIINFSEFFKYNQCANMIKSFFLKQVDNNYIEFDSDKELMKFDITFRGKKLFEYEL